LKVNNIALKADIVLVLNEVRITDAQIGTLKIKNDILQGYSTCELIFEDINSIGTVLNTDSVMSVKITDIMGNTFEGTFYVQSFEQIATKMIKVQALDSFTYNSKREFLNQSFKSITGPGIISEFMSCSGNSNKIFEDYTISASQSFFDITQKVKRQSGAFLYLDREHNLILDSVLELGQEQGSEYPLLLNPDKKSYIGGITEIRQTGANLLVERKNNVYHVTEDGINDSQEQGTNADDAQSARLTTSRESDYWGAKRHFQSGLIHVLVPGTFKRCVNQKITSNLSGETKVYLIIACTDVLSLNSFVQQLSLKEL